MKNSLISAFNKLKQAKDYFEDFAREVKEGIGEKKANLYIKKIDWIILDFKTIPAFNDEIRQAITEEMHSDSFQPDALCEKFLLLEPNKRELIETVIDAMLKGEEIIIQDKIQY